MVKVGCTTTRQQTEAAVLMSPDAEVTDGEGVSRRRPSELNVSLLFRFFLICALLVGSLIAGWPLLAGSKPVFVELINNVSDGTTLELCGTMLEDPLPPASQVTALQRLGNDGERGEGVILLKPPGRGAPLEFPVSSDENGAFCARTALETPLAPGRYTVLWRSTLGQQECTPAQLRVVDPTYQGLVIVSDIDQTYLRTDFQGVSAVTKLMNETASDKKPFVGMPEVFRAMAGESRLPIVFLSGSPSFFRPTLDARLSLDGIEEDLLILKPMEEIARRLFKSGQVAQVPSALKEQVTYKLERLLQLRLQYPVGAWHILLGDDVESDPVIYGLYRDILGGYLSPEVLGLKLRDLEVEPDATRRLQQLAVKVLQRQAGTFVRVEVFIRRHPPVRQGALDARIHWHDDSYQLAIALQIAGVIQDRDVRYIGRLFGEGATGDAERARSVARGITLGLFRVDDLYGALSSSEVDRALKVLATEQD